MRAGNGYGVPGFRRSWWWWGAGVLVVGLVVGKYADELYGAFFLMVTFTKYWLTNVL